MDRVASADGRRVLCCVGLVPVVDAAREPRRARQELLQAEAQPPRRCTRAVHCNCTLHELYST